MVLVLNPEMTYVPRFSLLALSSSFKHQLRSTATVDVLIRLEVGPSTRCTICVWKVKHEL